MKQDVGTALTASGVVNLIVMGIGGALANECWFGMLMTGIPLVFLGMGDKSLTGDTGDMLGLLAWATIGQGLIAMIIGHKPLIVANVALIILGIAIYATTEQVPDPPPRKRRRGRRRRGRSY